MRNSQRFATVVGATSLAVLLAACGTNPTQPMAQGYPAGGAYPSAGVQGTQAAAIETGRVTDIQTVQMGATSATNPNVGRAIAGGIIGAVVGNVVGKNVNNGHNRSAATAIGGAAGAAVGSGAVGGLGRNDSSTASSGAAAPAYRVTVQTDQGAWRTYEVGALGDLRVGDRVRVENGVIYRS
ncbi:MAG TPA: glycine zipper 2TM domain-containing protein [Ramlibacter sp.]|jgi:uncharacterized protein YcfJ|uniref:glycine zipper 2TM domain-containing protein n=1 Tax=Ramlibacter sp. TaxID=1917967 RepID=UPI002D2934B0|nr:glycine zipper 2TM domain-containing protein [Ramlibacter sp.]HZY20692.1 glycine zipper 2TM domain-containing protein [Ramlibacter sp.]